MSYVEKIDTTVKALSPLTLGPRTLIVGPNGSGKTGVLQAIALALTGVADDVAGRATVERGDFVESLASDGLAAVVILDNGMTATYSGGKGRAVYPDAWAWRGLRAALDGSADKARAWLLNAAGIGDVWTTHATSTVALKEAEARLATITEAIQQAAPAEAVELHQLHAAERDVEQQQRRVDAVKQAVERQAVTRRRNEIEAEIERVTDLCGDVAPNLIEIIEAGDRILGTIDAQIGLMVDYPSGVAPCGVCGARQHVDQFHKQRQKIQGRLEVLRSSSGHLAELARLQAELGALPPPTKFAMTTAANGRSWEDALVEAETELETAIKFRAVLIEAIDAGVAVRRLSADLGSTTVEVTRWKAKVKASKEDVKSALEEALPAFEAKINAFLPSDWRVGIYVDSQAARIGFRRDDRVDIALSGAERSALLLAIGCAVFDPKRIGPWILAPEDRGWDSKTLTDVMQATSTADGPQILLTSTVPPTGPVEGWTIIRLGELPQGDWPAFFASIQSEEVSP